MKITIVGTGYVGLSLAVLISKKYSVVALDIDQTRTNSINKKISPIKEIELSQALTNSSLDLKATIDKKEAYKDSEFIIVATPTNYDTQSGSFDTSSVEQVIADSIKYNSKANIFIKSTIPIGFTDKMRIKNKKNNIYFSPEFLRENKALYDNQYPSRIVVGGISDEAVLFSKILIECSNKKKNQIPVLFMNSMEAESVKLFANSYLAMRIAFFNELDSFSEYHGLEAKNLIEGIGFDPRIGNFYNNPSFGYGGYCLPKDTQQLLKNYSDVPNDIITAIVNSNKTRKKFVIDSILKKGFNKVGIYRLIMKTGSDNFRDSAVLDIIKILKLNKIQIIIYEPILEEDKIVGINIIKDFNKFISNCDLIIANRMSEELKNLDCEVYTRDIFRNN